MPTVREHDRGDSLIEILVALAILSIGVSALVTALGVNATTTVTNRSSAQLDAVLLSAAEHVKTLPFTTVCTGGLDWQPPLSTADLPRDAAFSVRWREAHVFNADATACNPSSTAASGTELAQVRIEVSGDGFQPRTLDVTVRRSLT